MKNLLLVVVALSVFTSVSAQKKINNIPDLKFGPEGIVFFSIPKAAVAAQKMLSRAAIATEMCSSVQFKYAQLLNREIESVTNMTLFSFIEDWWGTRYRYGGSSKSGIDCSSFTGLLMSSVYGFSLPRTAKEQYAACKKLTEAQLAEGDLVFFNTTGGVSHVGVYLGEGYFAHSSCSNGVTISTLEDPYYRKRFIACGRFGWVEGESFTASL